MNANLDNPGTVTLFVEMKNRSYSILLGDCAFSNTDGFIFNVIPDSNTTTSFKVQGKNYNNSRYMASYWWQVCGYKA